jgi:hypothetical protein
MRVSVRPRPALQCRARARGDGLGEEEELGDDGVGKRAAVIEGEVGDGDACGAERGGGIQGVVESNYGADVEVGEEAGAVGRAEVANAVRGVVPRLAGGQVDGALHRDELARDDDVQVGVERAVVVGVLLGVEAAVEVEPVELRRLLQRLPAVFEAQVEVLRPRRDVAVREHRNMTPSIWRFSEMEYNNVIIFVCGLKPILIGISRKNRAGPADSDQVKIPGRAGGACLSTRAHKPTTKHPVFHQNAAIHVQGLA